jgi:Na+/H+ antiporter NhaD/arsenite permease-like protein
MLSCIAIIAIAVFIIGFALIVFEHPLGINKAPAALVTAAILWSLIAFQQPAEEVTARLSEAGASIFEIVVFLLSAMCLVEILVHYRFFDLVRGKLYALNIDDKKQFLLIAFITFFLSAVIDNLTTTVIMIQISRKFFKGNNLLVVVAGIVIASNAGGTFSPIGDITTIMLWFAKKVNAGEIIYKAVLPALTLALVSIGLLMRNMKTDDNNDNRYEIVNKLERSEKVIISMVFISFVLPLAANLIGIAPYFGRLFGLGVVWLVIDILKRRSNLETHLSASIEEFIRRVDIASLKFFIGILLAVAALHAAGLLDMLAHFIYGNNPDESSLITGNIILGLISSILDNVPLTDIAIKMSQTTNSNIWILLALTVGTGGSLLVIGSASGVVAMGMIKELTFGRYFKLAFVPALLGFFAAVFVWYVQYKCFG